MKKKLVNKTIKVLLLFAMLCPIFTTRAFAWAGTRYFILDADLNEVPSGAVYVDLLMPIPENSEAYVAYNEQAGNEYRISECSQIAQYKDGEFVSYSFHCDGASSDMRLEPTKEGGDSAQTSYHNDEQFDMWYCCDKFKQAKAAYIDADGNILAVSAPADIDFRQWFDSGSSFFVSFQLSGAELIADVHRSVFIMLYFVELAGIIIFAPCTIFHACWELRRQKKHSVEPVGMNRSLKATCIVQNTVILFWLAAYALNIANQVFLFVDPDIYIFYWSMEVLKYAPLGTGLFIMNLLTYKEENKSTVEKDTKRLKTAITAFILFSLTKCFVYFSTVLSLFI